MAIVTDNYYLSLTQDNRVLRVRCSQGDSSRNINLMLYNNGSVFTIPSGVSASVRGVRQDGSVFSKSCSIMSGRTGVVLALNSAINGVAGIAVAEIVLTDGSGNKVGTSNFIIQVESNLLLRGTVEVGEESPVEYISDLIDVVDALNARVNNIISPSGEASLSEVVDARLSGYSGTTYQNLKARIDADFAALNNAKADKSNTYTKEEVDEAIAGAEIMTDETLSVSGAAADAKATGDAISVLNESLNNVLNFASIEGSAITPDRANGYSLMANGSAKSESGSSIDRYPVTEGTLLYLSLSADHDTTYQFQDTINYVFSQPNSHLIGTPVAGAVNGIVLVPDGATHLLVSRYNTTNTNSVKTASGIKTTIGDLSELETSDKTSIVNAINELVNAEITVNVDNTLSILGAAADSKTVGDILGETSDQLTALTSTVASNKEAADASKTELQNAINSKVSISNIQKTGTELLVDTYTITMSDGSTYTFTVTNGNDASSVTVEEAVSDWLDEHPEAIIMVNDGSVTLQKLNVHALPFVTPEMFGAVGDGETDDTIAIRNALNYAMDNGKTLKFERKTYGVIPDVSSKGLIDSGTKSLHAFLINKPVEVDLNNATIYVLTNEVVYWNVFYIFQRIGNVVIKNGTIIGDRGRHVTGTNYDSGKLINITDSENVTIENLILKDSKGDALGVNGRYNTSLSLGYLYPFEDFYMNIVVRNCILDHNNRNGITLGKSRGVLIEDCLITNTDGVNPKLGIDIEPVYGLGNTFETTIKNCIFRGNTNGCIGGYSPYELMIENCTGDEDIVVRNCPDFRMIDSKIGNLNIWGSNSKIKDCEISGRIKITKFGWTYQTAPSVLIQNCKGKDMTVPAATGTAFKDIVIDGCIFDAVGMFLDSHTASDDCCERMIIENCAMDLRATGSPNAFLFDTTYFMKNFIIKGNTINVRGGANPYTLLGYFRSAMDCLSFLNNKVIIDPTEEGISRVLQSLFYNYKPSESGVFDITDNVINAEGNLINSNGKAVTILSGTNTNANVIAKNNVFRGIQSLNAGGTATILVDANNSYGDFM